MKEMKIERKEKWVQINKIQGFEDVRDYYYISNGDEDKVINRDTGKMMKIGFNDRGYKIVGLMTINGKCKVCKIHIIKAKAFLFGPNPLDANVVRHLNDCKTDNRLINLAWGSQSDNMKDCMRNGNFNYEAAAKTGAKTSIKNFAKSVKKSKPVRCIETGIIYPSCIEAERQTGIHNASISHCCNGRYKTAGGYHWEFVNKEVDNNDVECE